MQRGNAEAVSREVLVVDCTHIHTRSTWILDYIQDRCSDSRALCIHAYKYYVCAFVNIYMYVSCSRGSELCTHAYK
jgi:hypothetical protein